MKIIIAVLTFASVFASAHEYQCVADRLQAINSDIYYNLSESDVKGMISIPEMVGHNDAINALRECEKTTLPGTVLQGKDYACIARELIRKDSRFMDVDPHMIQGLLTIPEMTGHLETVEAARACGL